MSTRGTKRQWQKDRRTKWRRSRIKIRDLHASVLNFFLSRVLGQIDQPFYWPFKSRVCEHEEAVYRRIRRRSVVHRSSRWDSQAVKLAASKVAAANSRKMVTRGLLRVILKPCGIVKLLSCYFTLYLFICFLRICIKNIFLFLKNRAFISQILDASYNSKARIWLVASAAH